MDTVTAQRRRRSPNSDRAPLGHAEELRRLLVVYAEYPGISGDIATLLAEIGQPERRPGTVRRGPRRRGL